MPNNYLSVSYKHIIQVENENVGLKVGGGTNIPLPPPPPIKKCPSPRFLRQSLRPSLKRGKYGVNWHIPIDWFIPELMIFFYIT